MVCMFSYGMNLFIWIMLVAGIAFHINHNSMPWPLACCPVFMDPSGTHTRDRAVCIPFSFGCLGDQQKFRNVDTVTLWSQPWPCSWWKRVSHISWYAWWPEVQVCCALNYLESCLGPTSILNMILILWEKCYFVLQRLSGTEENVCFLDIAKEGLPYRKRIGHLLLWIKGMYGLVWLTGIHDLF